MFSCCQRCRRSPGDPENSRPGSPAELSRGQSDEVSIGLLGSGGPDAAAPETGLRPRTVVAAVFALVAIAGASAVMVIRGRRWHPPDGGGVVRPVLQMLEEHGHDRLKGGARRPSGAVPEKALVGFLADMERKRGSTGPEAEMAGTRALLNKFLVKLKDKRERSRMQRNASLVDAETRQQILGFLDAQQKRNGSRGPDGAALPPAAGAEQKRNRTLGSDGAALSPAADAEQDPNAAEARASSAHTTGACESYGCVDYSTANACQCNKRCEEFGNCCADYAETCAARSEKQASHSCAVLGCVHFEPTHACQCNAGCSRHGDCCPDYREECAVQLK